MSIFEQNTKTALYELLFALEPLSAVPEDDEEQLMESL
jgi:hypothetical protein